MFDYTEPRVFTEIGYVGFNCSGLLLSVIHTDSIQVPTVSFSVDVFFSTIASSFSMVCTGSYVR